MYYRIAGVVLQSQIELPSFQYFACKPETIDVTLVLSDEPVPEGPEVSSADVVQRKTDEGWFYHGIHDDRMGLLVSGDYSHLRFVGHEEYIKGVMERRMAALGSTGANAGSGFSNQEYSFASYYEETLVRMALECYLARHGYVSLHAACVELDGSAYAFSGPSGTGKSTRARAWGNTFDAELVSGDRPLIDVKNMEVYGVPWDGKEQCYRNVHYPLRAIFDVQRKDSDRDLEPADAGAVRGMGAKPADAGADRGMDAKPANTAYIRKMTFEQKRKLLMRQCFVPMWDTETAVIQMMNIARLASSERILRAFCGRYPEDAIALREALENGEYKEEGIDLKAKEGFVLRDIVGEKILMPTGENIGKFKGTVLLNDVSAFVWEKLQTPMSRDDILAAILDEYEVEESVAAADLDALLAKLADYGVIEND